MMQAQEVLLRQWPTLAFAIGTALYAGFLLGDLGAKTKSLLGMYPNPKSISIPDKHSLLRQARAILFLASVSIFIFIQVCFLGGY